MSDKIKLYEVIDFSDYYGNYYRAYSLYNGWKGTKRYRKEEAEADGEKHQMALEYLFKGKGDK